MKDTAAAQMPLRIPARLHEDLKFAAESQGISLNQYCLYLLAQNVPQPSELLTQKAEELLKFLQEAQIMQRELEKKRPKPYAKNRSSDFVQTPLLRSRELYGKV